jgi:DNA repair protein RecO (recombination protein O)
MPTIPYLVTRGIVLRETETKETDKILTLLTPDHGKIAVIARGARRKNCRFAAAAQALAYSEWTLYRKGDWYYANEGETLELFAGLRRDLTRLSLGCYLAELTEAVTLEEVPADELLRHLLNGLYALDRLRKPEDLVKAAFEFRLLCLSGYEPLADACAVCGKEQPEDPVLDTVQGVVRCRGCGSSAGQVFPLCPDSLAALRHIVYGDPKRLYSFTLNADAMRRFSRAAESYTAVQLDRGFRTLDFYRSLLPETSSKSEKI